MPNFNVMANANSVSGGAPLATGISVAPGQLLTINADPCDSWAAGTPNLTSNANGLGNPFGTSGLPLFTVGDYSFVYGSLVGSLDGGKTYFAVGTRLEMTILCPGTLTLYYWDSDHHNNTDYVTATIALYTGPDTSSCRIKQK